MGGSGRDKIQITNETRSTEDRRTMSAVVLDNYKLLLFTSTTTIGWVIRDNDGRHSNHAKLRHSVVDVFCVEKLGRMRDDSPMYKWAYGKNKGLDHATETCPNGSLRYFH